MPQTSHQRKLFKVDATMPKARNDPSLYRPVQVALAHDNRTAYKPKDGKPVGLRGGSVPQIDRSPRVISKNRQHIDPNSPIVYADELGHMASANASANAAVSHNRKRSLESLNGHMVGDTASVNGCHGQHIGPYLYCQSCVDRRESHTYAQETRQGEGQAAVPGRYRLHSNDPQHDDIDGVENTDNSTGNRTDHGGYLPIAPRPAADRHYEHNTCTSPYSSDRQGTQDQSRSLYYQDQRYNVGFEAFDAAVNTPAIRGGYLDNRDQLFDAADPSHNARIGSIASARSNSRGAMGPPSHGVQRHEATPHNLAGDAHRRSALDQANRGSYPQELHNPRYDQPRLAAHRDVHGYRARSTLDEPAVRSHFRSPAAASSRPSTQETRTTASPDIKDSPLSSVGSLNLPAFDPSLYSRTEQNADGRPLYIGGNGIDPRAFLRPEYLVPHTAEPVAVSVRGGRLTHVKDLPLEDYPHMPGNYDDDNGGISPAEKNAPYTDQPGGPHRPTTKIGDRDHAIGWNGTKLTTLQPDPMPMPKSMVGPMVGVGWGYGTDYDHREVRQLDVSEIFRKQTCEFLHARKLENRPSAPPSVPAIMEGRHQWCGKMPRFERTDRE